jgi:uncharacterized protein YjbI with pentapeptide repeats
LTGVNLSDLAAVWDYDYTARNNLVRATLAGATLTGVTSGGIVGSPPLPTGWRLVNGFLLGNGSLVPGANLSGSNFSGLDLTNVDFTGANLTNVNFTNATLVNVTLTNATITNTTWSTDNENKLVGIRSGGLNGAPRTLPAGGRFRIVAGYLIGPSVNLTGAALAGSNFTGFNLRNVNFTGANLSTTRIDGADMSAATLTGVVSGGIEGRATLPPGWTLVDGYLVGPGANLRNANFYGSDLSGVDLTGADLTGADLAFATLTGDVWSNTVCPNGVRQSSECVPIDAPRVTLSATIDRKGRALAITVGPDLGRDQWTFTVQQRQANGDWRSVVTNQVGGNQPKSVGLAAGTYRVVVDPHAGYFGIRSGPLVVTA